jgi:hypothetical protein
MRADFVLRWTARVWSIASALLILAFVFGGSESFRPTVSEAVGLCLFPLGVVVGFGVAWWREALGGLITVGSLALFYLWMLTRDGRLPGGPYFLVFAGPGFLFLASALLRKSTKVSTTTAGTP